MNPVTGAVVGVFPFREDYLLTAHSQALNPAVYRRCLPIDMPIPDYSREA